MAIRLAIAGYKTGLVLSKKVSFGRDLQQQQQQQQRQYVLTKYLLTRNFYRVRHRLPRRYFSPSHKGRTAKGSPREATKGRHKSAETVFPDGRGATGTGYIPLSAAAWPARDG